MTQKFSQSALALVNSEKAKWAEIQFINAVDQLLAAQDEIESLKKRIDEQNELINKITKEKGAVVNGD